MGRTFRRNDRWKKDRRDKNFKKSKKFKDLKGNQSHKPNFQPDPPEPLDFPIDDLN